MISKISVKNFKSLKDIGMEIKPLNILMGLNGMGKSSFIQILLLLKQSMIQRSNKLSLNGHLVKIGKGKDALYQFSKDEFIGIKIKYDDDFEHFAFFKYKPESELLVTDKVKEFMENDILIENLVKFQYLTADHIGPQEVYETNENRVSVSEIGERGQYVAHFLHLNGYRQKIAKNLHHPGSNDNSLINQVNAWLNEISTGAKVNVVEVPHIDKILLNYQFKMGNELTSTFKPANVGFGISFALPVIVSLLLPSKNKIIILENPESHIHPRGQAELGKLIALAAANGATLFVETHSDHILNGIRVAAKEKLIDNNDINISFFDKITTQDEQYSRITNIKVDKNGELSDYPDNLLDEWNNQLLKLI